MINQIIKFFPAYHPFSMSVKGLVTLDTKSSILLENLSTRVLEGKREPCDIKFCDFDGVHFKISVEDETPNIVKVCMATPDWVSLSRYGAKAKIAKQYPGMETDPDEGYDMALEFNCDSLENPAKTLEDVANLRMHVLTAPIDAAMDSLVNGSGGNGEIQCR